MRTNEFGQTEVDTRTDSPASIGADMWAGSGDMSVAEAVAAYGSVVFAAEAIRDIFAKSGATWVDYDGHELSVYDYVKAYLKQAA